MVRRSVRVWGDHQSKDKRRPATSHITSFCPNYAQCTLPFSYELRCNHSRSRLYSRRVVLWPDKAGVMCAATNFKTRSGREYRREYGGEIRDREISIGYLQDSCSRALCLGFSTYRRHRLLQSTSSFHLTAVSADSSHLIYSFGLWWQLMSVRQCPRPRPLLYSYTGYRKSGS